MKLRHLLVFGFLTLSSALGFGALSTPAQAGALQIGIVSSGHVGSTVEVAHRRGHRVRRGYAPRRHIVRPARPSRYCTIERRMVMTPYGWKRKNVQVCRPVHRRYR